MDCEKCRQLRNPDSFDPEIQFQVVEGIGDCEKCVVTSSQPSADNEIIIELYDLLPKNYDGWTGAKIVSLIDVIELFRMFEIREELWDDYYLRLMYFHDKLFEYRQRYVEAKREESEAMKAWKSDRKRRMH